VYAWRSYPETFMSIQKRRHHYVPQFWIRRFSGSGGSLYQWDGVKCVSASAKKIMQEEWLNTVYDPHWQPSDWLEDQLSKLEAISAQLFSQLENPAITLTDEHRQALCETLALQACRHPDIFKSGHRKVAFLASLIADAPLYDSEADFGNAAAKLGMQRDDALAMYRILRIADPDVLEAEAKMVMSLSPQDPNLPMTDALLAMNEVAEALKRLSYELITAPVGMSFALGDTPLAQSNLGLGFVVPLNKDLAVKAFPTAIATIGRRLAMTAEVDASNRKQWEMAARIVVGPDPVQLHALGAR
jgi:hypothetical protein